MLTTKITKFLCQLHFSADPPHPKKPLEPLRRREQLLFEPQHCGSRGKKTQFALGPIIKCVVFRSPKVQIVHIRKSHHNDNSIELTFV